MKIFKKNISNNQLIVFIGLSLGILLLDFVTKFIVQKNSWLTRGHWVDINQVHNSGSLFGLFSSLSAVNLVFIILSFIVLGILFFYFTQNNFLKIPFAIISGGILGNLLDRLIHSWVFDFIDFHFWPVFNIADSAILIGIVLAIILLIRNEYF